MKIVSIFASDTRICVVQNTGETLYFDQGTPKADFIIKYVLPVVNEEGSWEGVLRDSVNPNEPVNDYVESSTVVRFFRVAKAKLASWFSTEDEPTLTHLSEKELDELAEENQTEEKFDFCEQVAEAPTEPTKPKRDLDKLEAVAKLITTTQDYKDTLDEMETSGNQDTMVAVVGDTVIEGAEKLEKYILTKGANTQEAIDNFFKRLATVIDKRRFSGEDLLQFLNKANLPLANDGSIIVYKALKKSDAVWVDIHSGTVQQTFGTVVYMDEDKVDPSRSQDCSHGLHIASVSYLRSFKGSNCFITKVYPEDVIAVPQYNVNKMRVCKYHLLDILSDAAYKELLSSGGSVNNHPDAVAQLHKAIAGEYPEPSSYNYLGDLGLHYYDGIDGAPAKPTEVFEDTSITVEVETDEEDEAEVETVAPIAELKSREERTEVPVVEKTSVGDIAKKASKKLSPKERIQELLKGFTPETLPTLHIEEINRIKRKQKKPYAKLGIAEDFHKVLKDG